MKKNVENKLDFYGEKSSTKKYIVDGPELKEGQKLGPGGVRENGKISSLFKNPILFEESALCSEDKIIENHCKDIIKEEMTSFAAEVSIDFIRIMWKELGAPLAQRAFSRLFCMIDKKRCEPIVNSEIGKKHLRNADHPDVDKNTGSKNRDKIVLFPNKRIV